LNCPLAQTCSFKDKQAPTLHANLQDIATLLAALYFKPQPDNQMAVYNSATVILKAFVDIVVDLTENNGIEWKIFLSELESLKSKKPAETQIVDGPLLVESDRDKKEGIKHELAEIEILIDKLGKSKNRKEKRRLLAIFNQRQAKIWGSE
jgi:hypothetical protein